MSKKSTKALASAALMSLVLTTALSAGPVKAAQGKVTRVSGADRYATASQVATANWESGSDSVVLVSGEGYADAVSASALAKKLGAPILLTEPGSLNADAQKALDTLKPKNVYVIGGNASISQSIRDGLKDKYTLTELGGANRYETNAAVADELVKLGVDASNALVVGGEGFSDALSVAPVAAAKGQILLLATNDQAKTQPVIDFVKKNNSKVTVVGTKNIINDTIYNALGASSRVDGGADRFATNIKVLNNFQGDLKSDKVYVANASRAVPDNLYADALVASAVAGKYSAPLVLVDKDPSGSTTAPNATDNAIAYLKNNTTSSTDFQVIGGTGVVSQAVEDGINAIYNNNNTNPEVSSISAVGLNQIKVVFNEEVDSDTAEDVANYKVDGQQLTKPSGAAKTTDATASLQDDNKTLLITLANKQKQNDDVDVTVKKGILSADKAQTVPEFTQTVTFSDTTAPTLDSVSVRGNNKLDIKFSEPVKASGTTESQALKSIVGKLKINDKNLSSFGINYDVDTDNSLKYSALDDAVKAKDDASASDYYYTDEVELYFDSALPTGNNTLKVSDADDNVLSDSAGFPIADTTNDFTVDTLTTAPEINSITAEDSGKIYVNFDRPMDAKTATDVANYVLNGGSGVTTGNISDATIDLKKNDTQVKISGVSLNKNSNKLYISNKVKDAYGNKVADDTYESFDLTQDTTKPTVNSVVALDDSTIRVRFSKDVDASYAKSVSNYKLKDSNGTDITSEIDPNGITIVDGKNTDSTASVFDIKLSGSNKLSDSKYTITIKNIQDKASTPNVMDEVAIPFDGSSDVNATVTAYKAGTENGRDKIALVFNKEMDSSSLGNTSNYQYVNNNGDTKTLPSGSDISVSSDNKSVIIKLPSSFTTDLDSSSFDNSNKVKAIYATNVKDVDGNTLSVGNNGGILNPANDGNTKIKPTSVRVYYNDGGDDLKADVSFTNPIDEDSLVNENFKLAGQIPTSVSVDGSKVTLTFASDKLPDGTASDDESIAGTLINTIKAAGTTAPLEIIPNAIGTDGKQYTVDDITGAAVDTSVEPQVYSYEAAPKLIINRDSNDVASNWNSNVDATNPAAFDINVKFDTPIENSSVKPSDFTFNVGGTTVDATEASAAGTTVTFKFEGSDLTKLKTAVGTGSTIKVTPTTSSKISSKKDLNGEYAYYVPSTNDTKTTYVAVSASDIANASDQTAVNTVASGITSFTPASAVAGTAELPTVPTGYTIAVKTTDTPTVYDTDGKIQSNGTANVVYTVTNTASGKTADTVSVPVTVTVTP
ncbi:Cell wall-binding repeat-containing protein [Clostridiaceae bacterium BL-3]|nr:Cell wall-binding repeat-containing protein [Clostridiaceae bacterium BL-3]